MKYYIKLNNKIKRVLIALILIVVFINIWFIIKNHFNKHNEEVYYFNYQDTNYQMGYSTYCYKVKDNLYCEVKGKDVPVFWYTYFEKEID